MTYRIDVRGLGCEVFETERYEQATERANQKARETGQTTYLSRVAEGNRLTLVHVVTVREG